MNTNQIVNLLDDSFTTVKVIFENTETAKQYTYKVLKTMADQICPLETIVAVPAYSNNILGGKLAVVVELDEEPDMDWNSDIEYRWIIGIVDPDAFNKCLESDDNMQKMVLKQQKAAARQKLKETLYLLEN